MAIIPNAPIRLDLLQIACTINDPALSASSSPRAAPSNPTSNPSTGPPGSVPMSGLFINTGFGMRPNTIPGVARGVADFLALGADPNADIRQLTRALPPISLAAQFSDTEAIRHLLQRGADPNRPGTQGVTPLMMAASAEDPNTETLSALLDAGAELHTRDSLGRTALDWALMQGESPVTQLLRARGAVSGERKPPVTPAAAKPLEPRKAVRAERNTLYTSAGNSISKPRCAALYHRKHRRRRRSHRPQTRRADLAIPPAAHPPRRPLEMWAPSRENLLAGSTGVFGFLGNVTYGLFGGLAEENVANPITDAAALFVSALFNCRMSSRKAATCSPRSPAAPHSSTRPRCSRHPETPPLRHAQKRTPQIAKARAYLLPQPLPTPKAILPRYPRTRLDRASSSEIARQSARLRSSIPNRRLVATLHHVPRCLCHRSGGLYAIHAAESPPRSRIPQRSGRFLLRTKPHKEPGSSPPRRFGFQPYLETGFPTGATSSSPPPPPPGPSPPPHHLDLILLPATPRAETGKSKFFIPGLWDMHSHHKGASADCLDLFAAKGVVGHSKELHSLPTRTHNTRFCGLEPPGQPARSRSRHAEAIQSNSTGLGSWRSWRQCRQRRPGAKTESQPPQPQKLPPPASSLKLGLPFAGHTSPWQSKSQSRRRLSRLTRYPPILSGHKRPDSK
ncbi:MAG: ankyrin repeat domain-containing protein [Bryobacteraceae bacterium]